MKSYLVRVVVNNAGLDFEDDVTFVNIETKDATLGDVNRHLWMTDQKLREEDSEGNCGYDNFGWNADTLLDALCKTYDYTWSKLSFDLEYIIG